MLLADGSPNLETCEPTRRLYTGAGIGGSLTCLDLPPTLTSPLLSVGPPALASTISLMDQDSVTQRAAAAAKVDINQPITTSTNGTLANGNNKPTPPPTNPYPTVSEPTKQNGLASPGNNATNSPAKLAALLSDAYTQIEALNKKAGNWEKIALDKGEGATEALLLERDIALARLKTSNEALKQLEADRDAALVERDQLLAERDAVCKDRDTALHAKYSSEQSRREDLNDGRARRLAMTDQWHQLRDYLDILDQHSRSARAGLDRLFDLDGSVEKLELPSVPLVSDVNREVRVWREHDGSKRKRSNSPLSSSISPINPISLTPRQTHVFAPVITGAPSKRPRYAQSSQQSLRREETELLDDTSPRQGDSQSQMYPATDANGQRICRSCGAVGRYKEGKCVEKWGPGPCGPGTVCDRCRKKMKRVERRKSSVAPMIPALAGNNVGAHEPRAIVPIELAQVAAAGGSSGSFPIFKEYTPKNVYPIVQKGPPTLQTRVIQPVSLVAHDKDVKVAADDDGTGEDVDGDGEDEIDVEEEDEMGSA